MRERIIGNKCLIAYVYLSLFIQRIIVVVGSLEGQVEQIIVVV